MKLGENPPAKLYEEATVGRRFEDDFHGVDPNSGRPFSYGVPDGLWILTSIYGFLTLGAIGFAIARVFSKSEGVSPVVPAIMAAFLMTTIVSLLARKGLAVVLLGLVSLALGVGVYVQIAHALQEHTLDAMSFIVAILPFVAQSLATYYVWTLRRDRILE